MAPFLAPLAFISMPSTGEWVMILFVGIMIYGRRLPEVGRQIGRTVANLRRGFDDFRRELDKDDSLREVRSGMRDMRSALDAPRRALDPKRLVDYAMAEDGTSDHDAVIDAEAQRLAKERAAIEVDSHSGESGDEPPLGDDHGEEPSAERERQAEHPRAERDAEPKPEPRHDSGPESSEPRD